MTSLDSLNKDFKLEKKYDSKGEDTGKFDRKLVHGDWVQVEGVESLQNGIIIAILTVPGELDSNPTYIGFGNKSWMLMKDNNNRMNFLRKEQYTKEVLNRMYRVAHVNVINVTGSATDPFEMDTTFLVTAITDDTIPINYGGI
jgi:phage gp46-like protein